MNHEKDKTYTRCLLYSKPDTAFAIKLKREGMFYRTTTPSPVVPVLAELTTKPIIVMIVEYKRPVVRCFPLLPSCRCHCRKVCKSDYNAIKLKWVF